MQFQFLHTKYKSPCNHALRMMQGDFSVIIKNTYIIQLCNSCLDIVNVTLIIIHIKI